MKTEIYNWHVSPKLKTNLEREARRRNISLSAVLDMAAKEWLMKSGSEDDDNERQCRLQKAASECFGVIASGDRRRSKAAH
jgi:hypothetical protein